MHPGKPNTLRAFPYKPLQEVDFLTSCATDLQRRWSRVTCKLSALSGVTPSAPYHPHFTVIYRVYTSCCHPASLRSASMHTQHFAAWYQSGSHSVHIFRNPICSRFACCCTSSRLLHQLWTLPADWTQPHLLERLQTTSVACVIVLDPHC